MLRPALIGLGVALIFGAAAGAAAADQPQAVPQTQPAERTSQAYWLRVIGDSVNLRSRGDANSAIVARLPRDTVLRGIGEEYGWHQVVPPDGTFSYVSAEYVELKSPSLGVVAVRSGKLRVRVGSQAHKLDPLRSEVQTLLPDGAEVRILGQEGDWLRIEPPAGVFAHISGDFVERVTDEVAARLRAATGQVTSQPAVALRPVQPPAPETRAPEAPNLAGDWGQKLAVVEQTITAEGRKPAAEQAWAPVLAQLQPIAAQNAEPMVARLAVGWMARLEERMADQETLLAASQIARRASRDRSQLERELDRLERIRQQATSQPTYDARGSLLPSYAFRSTDTTRRYKLQDPFSRRVVAYIEIPADGLIAPLEYVGKYVGVRGAKRFDIRLGANVIQVTHIVDLHAERAPKGPARESP
ncbi:MAG: SH3 domain-containing protein [Planctomycetes bacterium]|nr:SH3 domain-containing protein [Planctomycetota bacterium]